MHTNGTSTAIDRVWIVLTKVSGGVNRSAPLCYASHAPSFAQDVTARAVRELGAWMWNTVGSRFIDLGILVAMAILAAVLTFWAIPKIVWFVRRTSSFFAQFALAVAWLYLFIWLYYQR